MEILLYYTTDDIYDIYMYIIILLLLLYIYSAAGSFFFLGRFRLDTACSDGRDGMRRDVSDALIRGELHVCVARAVVRAGGGACVCALQRVVSAASV